MDGERGEIRARGEKGQRYIDGDRGEIKERQMDGDRGEIEQGQMGWRERRDK